MLTDNAYLTAIYIYVGAAIVLLLYLAWWLGRHWRPGWVTLVVLVLALPLMMAYWLAPALVYFEQQSGIEAMRLSLLFAARNWPAFLLYGVVMGSCAVLSIMAFGVGLLLWVPWVLLSLYVCYQDMIGAGPVEMSKVGWVE